MKKELSPSLEMVACDVCGRTILQGERTEPYLVPDGSRRLVCELCTRRAEGAGWLRESLHGDLPAAAPRAEPRRSLLGRLRQRLEDGPAATDHGYEEPVGDSEYPAGEGAVAEAEPLSEQASPGGEPAGGLEPAPGGQPASGGQPAPEGQPAPGARRPLDDPGPAAPSPGAEEEPLADDRAPVAETPPLGELPEEEPLPGEPLPEELAQDGEPRADPRAARRERRQRRRLRDPRHVRAVPTNAEAKVERALEVFNLSDYRRTVAGLVRTLGQPWVTALPHAESTSEVTVVVAWELSWYQFRVDLGDSDEPVSVADKGHELGEIDSELRRWNASATDDGALEPGGARA